MEGKDYGRYDHRVVEPKWPQKTLTSSRGRSLSRIMRDPRSRGASLRGKEGYNHRLIESKWEKRWEKGGIYKAIDFDKKQKKYILFEFPYPSGERLHIGHAFAFTGTDILAHFYRMKGFNVLCPIGWDAFGLPAENYAVKTGINPMITTAGNIVNSKVQAKRWGLSVDWDREISTTDPKYYKWTQWIFLQWYKRGLAYKEEMPINWCPKCKIGLANEEVIGGNCERCGTETTRRNIKQWIVKITAYADRLIDGLKNTAFIEKVKAAQINWIGRSEGAEINFQIAQLSNYQIKVFTTRPDTLYGATFMVISPEHFIVQEILNSKSEILNGSTGSPSRAKSRDKFKIQNLNFQNIADYVNEAKRKSDLERTELNKEKTGVFSGLYAINPATGKEIPVWISDFVLSSYGSGAIMAVPAHDERDFAFAKKFGLPIVPVIVPKEGPASAEASAGTWDFDEKAYIEVEKGITINSPEWNGIVPSEAIKKATEWIKKKGIGEKSVSYHLRDWIFSRQHYWGEPIPIIYCEKCGEVPVPEDQLPVKLPEVENYKPTDTGESPLAAVEEWTKVACPECGGAARRETDTMPNWAGSDWYFLRYADPHNNKTLVDLEKAKYWLPVDVYVGGDEHNTLHLLYSRFTYQFLWDIGAVPKEITEPYYKRLSHGVILGPDGQRMSKSRGNVINPDEIIEAFGADSLRLYLMFMGPFDYTMSWNQESLEGCYRFLKRVWNLVSGWKNEGMKGKKGNEGDGELERKLNQTIKKVGEDIDNMKFNTAIAAMMELLNEMYNVKCTIYNSEGRRTIESFLLLLSPFAPHIAEELWERLGKRFSIHQQRWPEYNPDLLEEEKATIAVQINGKLRGTVEVQSAILRRSLSRAESRGSGQEFKVQSEVEEMAKENEKIMKYLKGKEIKRTIYVPGKLINFVF